MKIFTIEEIEKAHEKVKTGAGFPGFIREIRSLGVERFETRVADGRTVYFGEDGFTKESGAVYTGLKIAAKVDKDEFVSCLHIHQQGHTDYLTFCRHCAETGVDKWVVDLNRKSCTYYDLDENIVLEEQIPI